MSSDKRDVAPQSMVNMPLGESEKLAELTMPDPATRPTRAFAYARSAVRPFPPGAFGRYDESSDALFYVQPRFVTHIDEPAIAAVTQLYRELFPPGGSILDLMSSWVSHLPADLSYSRVVGVGLNRAELAANPRLDAFVVQDLNDAPRLPFADGEFDAAAICVSIQYLTSPVEVLRDLGRVLRPGAPLVVTFSNRCFPTKAVALWQALDDAGHAQLVADYLRAAGNWMEIETLDRSPRVGDSDPLLCVIGRRNSVQASGGRGDG